jgi:simple sugar transport system permease protein
MTVTVDKNSPEPEGTDEALSEKPPGLGRRLAHWYLYGNQFVVTILAFIVALAVGAILIAVSDSATRKSLGYFTDAPGDTFSNAWKAISAAYSALFRGSIFNPDSFYSNGGTPIFGPISDTLVNAAPLIIGGLAVAVAFRAGLFNIGVQGQLIAGAICAGYVGFHFSMPQGIHLAVALVAGVLGGAFWGSLVGILKAKTGAHEVITTIMLNYVALGLLTYLLGLNGFQRPGANDAESSLVKGTARLPNLFQDLHSGIFLAIAAAGGCWWLFSRSTLGFRLRAVGFNPAAARTAGIKIARNYIIVMVISGALAGLVGCSQVLGSRFKLTPDIDDGLGFDAITVALLGRGTPLGTVLAGLLFGAFRAGGVTISVDTSTPSDIVSVLEPLMVLFLAAPALIRGMFGLRATRAGTGTAQIAKGWNG